MAQNCNKTVLCPSAKLVSEEQNRKFPSCFLPLCQNESSCEAVHTYDSRLQVQFHVNQTNFSYERFSTWTRFETEVQGNSEMASGANAFFLYP